MNLPFKIILISFFMISGCSSMNKKTCLETNWHQKGYDDVRKNKDWSKKLEKYDKVCSKKSVFIPKKHYINGVQTAGGQICTGYRDFQLSDWNVVGSKDALSGSASKESIYNQKCTIYSLKVNKKTYDQGYKIGLNQFCTKENGFTFGKMGGGYEDTCPKSLEPSFLKALRVGYIVREADFAQNRFESAKRRIRNIPGEIETKSDEISSATSDLESLSDETNSSRRRFLSDLDSELSDLSRETSRLSGVSDEDEIRSIRSRIDSINSDIEDINHRLESLSSDEESRREDLLDGIEEARDDINKLNNESLRLRKSLNILKSESINKRLRADNALKKLAL